MSGIAALLYPHRKLVLSDGPAVELLTLIAQEQSSIVVVSFQANDIGQVLTRKLVLVQEGESWVIMDGEVTVPGQAQWHPIDNGVYLPIKKEGQLRCL